MAEFRIRNFIMPAIAASTKAAIGRGLYAGASHVLNESNAIAPKDEGTLIQTSGVSVDEEAGTATVYYTQKYAPRMHENPQFNFQGGRQGKFLEKKAMSEGDAVRDLLAASLRQVLGG